MCWQDVKTGETGDCITKDSIRDFLRRSSGSIYIGHNICGFDARVLNRLVGSRLSTADCIDTFILSTLYSPSLEDGHSLSAWGGRLKKPKGDFNDWSRLSDEMLVYCRQDVAITAELFVKLIRVLNKIGFSEKSIEIQHKFMAILDRQKANGFKFNGEKAINLFTTLRSKAKQLEDQIHDVFPPTLECIATYKKAFNIDGSHNKQYERHVKEYHRIELDDGGGYRAYDYVSFGIGSSKQRVEKLMELGWKPEEFTPRTRQGGGGNPKPFDKGDIVPSLQRFLAESPTPEVEMIARWMSLTGRSNMINNWLENWNEETGCIHGSLFVADTLRLKHSSPNTANIPGVRVSKSDGVLYGDAGVYTYEARDCWEARRRRVLVGTDAAGLELRMLADRLNRPAFTEQVVNGDPHQFNADQVGIARPLAKTLLYAIQYGAQGPKVASIIKSSNAEGSRVRQQFLDRLGLTGVMDDAQHEQANGRIRLVDGSMVVCPSQHSALNYKLQGSGARVMALGSIILEGYIRRDGLDSLKVGDIHDEWQYDVLPSDADRHAERSIQAIREAGEDLNLNVPLDGTAKEGLTWAETH